MKNTIKLLAVFTVITVTALTAASCDMLGSGQNGPSVEETGESNQEVIEILTENTWSDLRLNIKGESRRFKFTATASEQFIHFYSGTLTDVNLRVHNSDGREVGQTSSLDSSYLKTSRAVTPGREYYVEIIAYSQGGTYRIAFSSSSSTPPVQLPTANITELTEHTWAGGNITESILVDGYSTLRGEQWFKFTATASEQFIHFSQVLFDVWAVHVYDSEGYESSQTRRLIYDNESDSSTVMYTLIPGGEYYVRVWVIPDEHRTGMLSYRILFNSSDFMPVQLPAANITQLTENTLASGNITSRGGEQWFKFTATASEQFIHLSPGTLHNVYVQVYGSDGYAVGDRVDLYHSTLSMSRTVTTGSGYYVMVKPYTSSGTGTYRIGFSNTSVTPQ